MLCQSSYPELGLNSDVLSKCYSLSVMPTYFISFLTVSVRKFLYSCISWFMSFFPQKWMFYKRKFLSWPFTVASQYLEKNCSWNIMGLYNQCTLDRRVSGWLGKFWVSKQWKVKGEYCHFQAFHCPIKKKNSNEGIKVFLSIIMKRFLLQASYWDETLYFIMF